MRDRQKVKSGSARVGATVATLWFLAGTANSFASMPSVLSLEPGVWDGGAYSLPLCSTDSNGVHVPLRASEIVVEIDGRRTAFDMAPSAAGVAIAFLFALPRLTSAEAAAWAELIADLGRGTEVSSLRAVFVVGEDFRVVGDFGDRISTAEAEAKLAASRPGPLWDSIVTALDRLSAPGVAGGAVRRVLVVVAAGVEAVPGRHPMLACLDAAARARIAVHVLALCDPQETNEPRPGHARLSRLAKNSGGRMEVACGEGVGVNADVRPAMRRLVDRIERSVMLRCAISRPVEEHSTIEAKVTLIANPGIVAKGTLGSRHKISTIGLGFWPAFGLVILSTGATVWGMRALRARPLGVLAEGRGESSVIYPLPHGGGSIGTAAGNTVVVNDPRVSRRHAMITLQKGKIVLIDLRSTNGTSVNGRNIRSACLRDGDRINLAGAVDLTFRSPLQIRPGKGRRFFGRRRS